jgi:hypothetical protein
VYEGGFSFDAYHGNGTLTYPNGDVYTGNFNKDWPEGPGKMIYKNGDIYEGGFSSYQKNGKGLMKFGTGGLYEGDFLNDQQHGKGKMVFANGNVYTGDFTNGNAHGNGILLFGGNKADGKFENNQIVKGKLTTKTGLIADGEFASDGNFKKGTVYYTNGTVATGEFNGENNPVAGKVTYIKGGPVAPAATTTIKTDENFCTELKKLIGYSKNHFRDIKGNVTTRSKAEFTTSYTLTDAIYSYIYEFSEYASMEIQLCKNTAKPGDKNKFQFDCKKDYLSIIRKCMAAESFTEVKQDADGIPGLLFTGNVYLFKNKDNITVKYGMLLHGATINISKDY